MTQPLPKKEVDKRMADINLKMIGEFIGVKSPTEFKCFCGKLFLAQPYSVFKKHTKSCGCSKSRFCADLLRSKNIIEKLKAKGFDLVGEYVNALTNTDIRCFCGKVFKTTPNRILTGNTKSCGCSTYKFISEHKRISKEKAEIRLQKRGFKLVGEYVSGETKADIQCHCGKIFNCVPNFLFIGKQISCGCLKNRSNERRKQGYEQVTGKIIAMTRFSAKRRGYIFDLTSKYLWDLFVGQNKRCALTGRRISLISKPRTASIDRIDNDKGYVEGNVHWVYLLANTMKRDIPIDKFIEICRMVSEHNSKWNVKISKKIA